MHPGLVPFSSEDAFHQASLSSPLHSGFRTLGMAQDEAWPHGFPNGVVLCPQSGQVSHLLPTGLVPAGCWHVRPGH